MTFIHFTNFNSKPTYNKPTAAYIRPHEANSVLSPPRAPYPYICSCAQSPSKGRSDTMSYRTNPPSAPPYVLNIRRHSYEVSHVPNNSTAFHSNYRYAPFGAEYRIARLITKLTAMSSQSNIPDTKYFFSPLPFLYHA